jgi:hypothetical protein
LTLDPSEFSIRLHVPDFNQPLLNTTSCLPFSDEQPSLQAVLEAIPAEQVERLQRGVAKAGQLYAWYAESPTMPQNPLQAGVLPNGGTAHFVVQALAERASGARWAACEEEMKHDHGPDPSQFKC